MAFISTAILRQNLSQTVFSYFRSVHVELQYIQHIPIRLISTGDPSSSFNPHSNTAISVQTFHFGEWV
mgnify:FL=1